MPRYESMEPSIPGKKVPMLLFVLVLLALLAVLLHGQEPSSGSPLL